LFIKSTGLFSIWIIIDYDMFKKKLPETYVMEISIKTAAGKLYSVAYKDSLRYSLKCMYLGKLIFTWKVITSFSKL
jgi:hypothetical protein